MVFKNIKNEQIANILDENLIKEFQKNKDWELFDNNNQKEVTFEEFLESDKIQKQIECEQLKIKLTEISKDILQYVIGEDVPNYEKRKEEFFVLHNRLRTLEGKAPRQLLSK